MGEFISWRCCSGPRQGRRPDPVIDPKPGATRGRTSASGIGAPAPTGHKPTAPVERFNLTLLNESAHAEPYRSESTRRKILTPWLHLDNHHRPQSSLDGRAPITRLTNVLGQSSWPTTKTQIGYGRVKLAAKDQRGSSAKVALPGTRKGKYSKVA